MVFGNKIDRCELTGIKVRFVTIFVYKMLLPGEGEGGGGGVAPPVQMARCELIIVTGQSVGIPVTRYEITILE